MYYGSDFSEVYVGYGVCKSNNIDKAIKKYTVIASTVLPMHVNLWNDDDNDKDDDTDGSRQ